jgi:hypothetical protein
VALEIQYDVERKHFVRKKGFQVEVEEQAMKAHLHSSDCQDVDTSRLEGSSPSEVCMVCPPRRHAEEG